MGHWIFRIVEANGSSSSDVCKFDDMLKARQIFDLIRKNATAPADHLHLVDAEGEIVDRIHAAGASSSSPARRI